MQLTAELVLGLTTGLLQARYDRPQPTPPFHMDLWRLCCSEDTQVAIAAPRGHAKSTSVTHAYTLAAVLFRVKRHVLIISDTEGQASDFLKDIKLELEENEELIELFDIRRFVKENESEIIVEMGADRHQFRILAKGAGQKVRGKKWRHTRYDLIVGDDLENDEIVLNAERREKFRKWLNNAVLPSGSDNCSVRIVGTILHFDSMLERLMPKEDKEKGIKLIQTDLAEFADVSECKPEDKPAWTSVRYRAHNPDYSAILWPEKFTKARLIRIRNTYLADNNLEGYAQEYLNYPIDEGTAFFRKSDILPMADDDWKKSMIFYVGGDFAISQKQRADYTVFTVVGIDPEGQAYVVDVVRGRWDTFEIVENIFALQQRYNPESFFFEKGQIFLAMEPVMLKHSMISHIPISYMSVDASVDKEIRARPLQFRVRAGGLKFDIDAPWYADFEQEMLRFPKGGHDDQVDSLAHIFLKLSELSDAPTYAERAQDAYEEELEYYEEFLDDGSQGSSPITGY